MSTKEMATNIVETMAKYGLTLCFAESCTAGGIPKIITSVPGASKVLMGGTTAYHPQAIANTLGFKSLEELAEHFDMVSEDITSTLAQLALDQWKADICIATTGYLGPFADDDPENHQGWIVVMYKDGAEVHSNLYLDGKREANRQKMLRRAFELVEFMFKRVLKDREPIHS